jgi:hypothetical protein
VALLVIVFMLYYNTGWVQFGYRFSLDFMTPVLVLLAIGAGQRVSRLMRFLIIVGVLVNLWGVRWFNIFKCATAAFSKARETPESKTLQRGMLCLFNYGLLKNSNVTWISVAGDRSARRAV